MIANMNYEFISNKTSEALEVYASDMTENKTFKLKYVTLDDDNEVKGGYYRHLEDGYMVYEFLPR